MFQSFLDVVSLEAFNPTIEPRGLNQWWKKWKKPYHLYVTWNEAALFQHVAGLDVQEIYFTQGQGREFQKQLKSWITISSRKQMLLSRGAVTLEDFLRIARSQEAASRQLKQYSADQLEVSCIQVHSQSQQGHVK